MRRKIANESWEQITTGYAAGVGLREIARKMSILEGTVLAHAKQPGLDLADIAKQLEK
jgi:hypothetical protein